MNNSLDRLTIQGFKSIKNLTNFELKKLNIIVGANGAGKSNLISFFKLMRALIDRRLNRYVRDQGGVSDLLFHGRKITNKIFFETRFGECGFRFSLVPKPNDECAIEDEAYHYAGDQTGWRELGDSENGQSKMVEEIKQNKPDALYSRKVYDAISSWQVYHFHDTSSTAPMRGYEIVEDNAILRANASNIGAFLLNLRAAYPNAYSQIVDAVKLVIPFFDDFVLVPRKSGEKEKVNLSWRQQGSDYPMQPYHLSDGSIRFICLAATLLQPNLPATIIIDEPELGLHPAALVILAELIQSAATRTQVIIATQSPMLIDQFSVNDIIVAGRKKGASYFKRLQEADFSQWLKDYSVGELWVKNVIAGGPTHE